MSDQTTPASLNVNEQKNINDEVNCETFSTIKKPIAQLKTVESESQTDNCILHDCVLYTTPCVYDPNIINDKNKKETNPYERGEQEQKQEQEQENIDRANELLGEAEQSVIEIKERIIDLSSKKVLNDSESEEDDQLKPLMMDNHTIIEHQEFFNYNAPSFHPSNLIKHCDLKDPYSSTDSENSINCDRKTSLSVPIKKDLNAPCHEDAIRNIDCDTKPTTDVREIDTIPITEIPDDRMCEEIVEQVEYYFSNESILKDAFLLKHVRRNKEGFVSLKLVSSFKRVRQLTKDWRVVGYAIRRKSKKIELNDLGTKIRRLEALPTFDETMPSRTIVACDLPVDKLSIEKVTEIFSKCGEIALVRILKPGMGIPVDVRQFMNKYPEMQQKECALVEFIESQSARYAKNINGNFQVYDMVAPKKKTGKKAQTITKFVDNFRYRDNNFERSRGGSTNGINITSAPIPIQMENDFKYKLRRNNSEYYPKPESPQQYLMYQQRKYSYNGTNNENNFIHYSPRRISNCSVNSNDMSRKYSSCSEGYSSCSEMSRRTSGCSTDQSRRTSNCSDLCPCSRRMSQCSDVYRRFSQYPEHGNRRFSSGAIPFERSYSSPQDTNGRRISMDSNYERKISSGSINGSTIYDPYRKFSNGFDLNRKLSNPDQCYYGRRTSTDSGYDRKQSFGSDYGSSPRSRSNSFLVCQHKNIENVVRTPIGPDGSKGFASRTRKLGQIVPPVN